MSQLFETQSSSPLANMVMREYQRTDYDVSLQLWNSGTIGVLTRGFTGCGKTICAALKTQWWLERGSTFRCMVLSYERELVRQFANEMQDVLGIEPAIEMADQSVSLNDYPRIVVASRQTLQCRPLASLEQRQSLIQSGVPETEIKLLTKSEARSILDAINGGCDTDLAVEQMRRINGDWTHNHDLGRVSRLYKFDANDNWLLICDEAHKYAMHLKQVGHIVEWFEKNPDHRRNGLTATPKRSDNTSIGDRLFPGVALDFSYARAVKEGYAVPFLVEYITVEGVDFKNDFVECKTQEDRDEKFADMMQAEEKIASLCDPLLKECGERRTIVFSATVAMAQKVHDYINARRKCFCSKCHTIVWRPTMLLQNGTTCPSCSEPLNQSDVIGSTLARFMDGETPHTHRQQLLADYRSGEAQFLSVCGLCKEGFNDPPTSCVAVFRPVSKAAASLAEQMKGRASRVLPGVIDGLATPVERIEAIAASEKKDALIIDMVGISGLGDCASTLQIYAEGFPDAVVARAQEILLQGGMPNVLDALDEAQKQLESEKREEQRRRAAAAEAARKREAERRATLDASTRYEVYSEGVRPGSNDPHAPTEKMLKCLAFYGLQFVNWSPSRAQASRMIAQFKGGLTLPDILATNRLPDGGWEPSYASSKQMYKLRHECGYRGSHELTPKQASDLIERHADPLGGFRKAIAEARDSEALTKIAVDIFHARERLGSNYEGLVIQGRARRAALSTGDAF